VLLAECFVYRIGILEKNSCVCVCVWKRTVLFIKNVTNILSQGGPLCHNKIHLCCKNKVLTAVAFLFQKISHVVPGIGYLVYTDQILLDITQGPFPGGKEQLGRDTDHSPTSSAKAVNE
jgi:hypothetical protein